MSRCIYCNKETPSYIMVKSRKKDKSIEYSCCSLKCFKKAERFFKCSSVVMRVLIPFLILYITIAIFAILGHIPTIYASITTAIMGLGYVIFPFSTKRNVEQWSIKKTELWARITGGLFIFMGLMGLL